MLSSACIITVKWAIVFILYVTDIKKYNSILNFSYRVKLLSTSKSKNKIVNFIFPLPGWNDLCKMLIIEQLFTVCKIIQKHVKQNNSSQKQTAMGRKRPPPLHTIQVNPRLAGGVRPPPLLSRRSAAANFQHLSQTNHKFALAKVKKNV